MEIREFTKDAEQNTKIFPDHYRGNSCTQLKASYTKRGITPFTMHGLRRLRVDTLQRQRIEPAIYEQIMRHSMRVAQKIYRTTNTANLQNPLREQSVREETKIPQSDVLSTLIGKLGLSLEEALVRLMG